MSAELDKIHAALSEDELTERAMLLAQPGTLIVQEPMNCGTCQQPMAFGVIAYRNPAIPTDYRHARAEDCNANQ